MAELVRAGQRLAAATMTLGHTHAALAFQEQAEDLWQAMHEGPLDTGLATVRLLLDWSSGRWDGIDDRLTELLEEADESLQLRVSLQLVRASLLLARGEVHHGRGVLSSIVETAPRVGVPHALVNATALLARLESATGNPDRARRVALSGLGVVRAKGIWVWATRVAPAAVDAFVGCTRLAEAEDLTDELAQGLDGRDAPAAFAALSYCQAAVAHGRGRVAYADERFERAAREFDALPRPYEAAYVRERHGSALAALGDPRAAILLRGAEEAFAGLGANWDAARVRSALRQHGFPIVRRGGRRRYGNQLSPREAQVAGLAASGRTNREIAASLFISPRTVEDHVAAARRKLGVDSRHALAPASGEINPYGSRIEPDHGLRDHALGAQVRR